MNIHVLEVFITVAEARSISKAAKQLHLTQPAVSSLIQSLEQYYGHQLFFRTVKGVQLNPAGEIVYTNIKKIFEIHAAMKEKLNELRQNENLIHIGATEAFGNFLLPYTMGSFRRQYPEVRIDVSIFQKEEIFQQLQEKKIDLGVIEDGSTGQIGIESVKIGTDPIILAVSYHSSFAKIEAISLNELESIPLILASPSLPIRRSIENKLSQMKFPIQTLDVVSEMSSIQALKTSVISGLGASFFYKSCIEYEVEEGLLHPLTIEGLELETSYYLLYQPKNISVIGQQFLSYLLETKDLIKC
ncbi:MAG: LysR family transcriptional regulator [Tepidibacillus sp.]|uniref:LysR family transcriptional regulator n=1 Tax=Tepidibacillus sp. HK-1 TaxID=1883407 RepID=UPI000853AAF6|nr:LysR family transcriptional regulator [Tepidibacillus sp. HK-1]GBF10304.1 HTH-type transcriptional activator CmpR [Tepidibacillus sp. HK-1]